MAYVLVLMVVLPLMGALFGWLTAGLGREHARRWALINVLVTFLLSAYMVARYDPERRDRSGGRELLQGGFSLPWVGQVPATDAEGERPGVGPDVEFALGVDGLSL